jgi:hypothetical protein
MRNAEENAARLKELWMQAYPEAKGNLPSRPVVYLMDGVLPGQKLDIPKVKKQNGFFVTKASDMPTRKIIVPGKCSINVDGVTETIYYTEGEVTITQDGKNVPKPKGIFFDKSSLQFMAHDNPPMFFYLELCIYNGMGACYADVKNGRPTIRPASPGKHIIINRDMPDKRREQETQDTLDSADLVARISGISTPDQLDQLNGLLPAELQVKKSDLPNSTQVFRADLIRLAMNPRYAPKVKWALDRTVPDEINIIREAYSRKWLTIEDTNKVFYYGTNEKPEYIGEIPENTPPDGIIDVTTEVFASAKKMKVLKEIESRVHAAMKQFVAVGQR